MNKLTKIKLLNIFFQFLNSFNLVFALALLVAAIYLIAQTGSFNSFTLALLIIGSSICFTSIFSFCCTNKSPCALLFAIILLIFIFLFVVTLGICIIFLQDKLIEFLVQSMKDSQSQIEDIKQKINSEMDITKIVALTYSSIIVKIK
jgi:thiol:disulfide interchange protein